MKTRMKNWLGAALLAMTGLAATDAGAVATTTAYLNIDVTITAQLSVKVDSFASSTQTIAWAGTPNQQWVNDGTGGRPSSATVTNDTGILSEKWLLATNANSLNVPGNAGTWSLAASSSAVGANEVALQAVFGSSNTAANGCLGSAATEWANGNAAPLLGTTKQLYTNTRYVGASLTNDGQATPDEASGLMYAGNKRALCWRLILPQTTSTYDTQNVQILVTATP